MSEVVLEATERRLLGERIDRLRHAKRWTLAVLAQTAGYDERTGRKIIKGEQVKYKTLLDFCMAVGISSIESKSDVAEYSGEEHGGYSKKSFNSYIGHYEAFRWSYEHTSHIMRSYFHLSWVKEKGLIFSENQRYRDDCGRIVDFSQAGEVYSNEEAGLIHLVTIVEGMVRLITLTRMQPGKMLKGGVLSQARFALYRRPAVSPIFLRKVAQIPSQEDMDKTVGQIAYGHPDYEESANELRGIEHDILLSTVGAEAPRTKRRPGEHVATVTRLSAVRAP